MLPCCSHNKRALPCKSTCSSVELRVVRLDTKNPIPSAVQSTLCRCHRRDPTVGLQFVGAAVTISLRTKGSQQPRCHHRTRSRQRLENEKIRMLGGCFLNLPVELRNALQQTAEELHDHFHHRAFGFDNRSIAFRRNRSADRQDATFPQSSMAMVLAEERSQFFRRYFLQLLQRRPALQ